MKHIDELPLIDLQPICVDCDQQYTFSIGEQQYFLSKGLAPPKRCPRCRQIRKATIIRKEGKTDERIYRLYH
jgi:hypothetical protein